MPRYEVLSNIGGDWENCWTIPATGEPVTYATREEAQAAIDDYIIDRRESVRCREVIGAYDQGDFMIRPITVSVE